jgi:hypothetical protein
VKIIFVGQLEPPTPVQIHRLMKSGSAAMENHGFLLKSPYYSSRPSNVLPVVSQIAALNMKYQS